MLIEVDDNDKQISFVETEIEAYDLILELLYNLRQLTLMKEVHDKTDAAEKLFLSGKIS